MMVLTKPQAAAIYHAMLGLNIVGGRITVTIDDRLRVITHPDYRIEILGLVGGDWESKELYSGQSHFARGYAL